MRILNIFLAILVSLAIGALVLEVGLRLVGKGPTKSLVQFDPVLGWAKKPDHSHVQKGRDHKVVIRTNEHGLHDDPLPNLAKPEGTLRVLMLGDSFVQGFSVGREDLFVDLLERWWQGEGRRVEVINAGTQGYDTAQATAWLELHGDAYQPDIVLLFPYENDLYWNAQPHYFERRGERDKPRYGADGTRQASELRAPPEASWLGRTAIGGLFGGDGVLGDPAQHAFQPQGSEAKVSKEFGPLLAHEPDFMGAVKTHTRGALRAFQRKAAQLGARALVVPIPAQTLYDSDAHARMGERLGVANDAWSPNRPVDLVLGLASELGLESLDPRSYLTEQKAAGVELYHEFDWHFGPAGNRAFATFLHRDLDRLGVFPPTHRASRPNETPFAPIASAGTPTWMKLYGVLWVLLTALYFGTYRNEPLWKPPLLIAGMLGLIFTIVLSVQWLAGKLPPELAPLLVMGGVVAILGFILYKLGRRLGTIAELLRSFVMRGHWYLMPLVVVLLTVGSLLVVAASSPFVAPFIYTLF